MDLREFVKLMRESFDLASEWIDSKPYYVRLIGPPFNSFVEGCRSIGVMAHDRGTRVSPYNIKQVLAKFDIKEHDFLEAYNNATRSQQEPPKSPVRDAKNTRLN